LAVPPFLLSCLTYLGVALPGSTLGMLWPSIRISIHEPVSALGIILVAGVAASAVSSTLTGRLLARIPVGPLLAAGAALVAAALAMESAAAALWLIALGSAVFSTGFGAIDAALNAYAAGHFGARQINWMHAGYGLGATLGPLLVTVLLAEGASWRLAFDSMAVVIGGIAMLLAARRHAWEKDPRRAKEDTRRMTRGSSREPKGAPSGLRSDEAKLQRDEGRRRAKSARRRAGKQSMLAGVAFSAVETGVESAAGIWGYVFLTSGRGLPAAAAGVVVSAYWAMMLAGRAVLGPVAERAGTARVLGVAVCGIPAGAVLMTVPAPAFVAVAGMLLLGLAAAPVFPLLTLTTADRVGEGDATAAVGLQVAASAVGSTALPSLVGLAIGGVSARVLGPSLLVLGLAMCVVYRLALRRPASVRSQPRA
jgi:fucose permease